MINKFGSGFYLAVALGLAVSMALQMGAAAAQEAKSAQVETAAPALVLPTIGPEQAESSQKWLRQDTVMARVGAQTITADEFTKYVAQDTRSVKSVTTDQGKAQVLREMIVDRLLEEGMRREGFLPKDYPPGPGDYLRGYNLLAAKHFPENKQTPPEKVIEQYYQEHQEEFGIPAMVRVGQIQFRVPENASASDREAAKARAAKALDRLKSGESFAALAGALTENPQAKATAGDLGFLPVHLDSWLKRATADLRVGQYSKVIESPVGYEILQLQDKRDALLVPLANAREKVLNQMRREAQSKEREAYARRLAKEIGVTVEIEQLKSAIP